MGKLKCIVRVTEGDPDDEPLFVDKKSFPTLAKAKARNDIILAELLKVTVAVAVAVTVTVPVPVR